MSKIVQEKFQVIAPREKTEADGWVSDKSARDKNGIRGGVTEMYNRLPPGMDIGGQECSDQPSEPLVMSGETDVSKDWNREAVANGYTKRSMRPTDDMYTNEHVDMFYVEAKVDGDVGFVERGNTLDRL